MNPEKITEENLVASVRDLCREVNKDRRVNKDSWNGINEYVDHQEENWKIVERNQDGIDRHLAVIYTHLGFPVPADRPEGEIITSSHAAAALKAHTDVQRVRRIRVIALAAIVALLWRRGT